MFPMAVGVAQMLLKAHGDDRRQVIAPLRRKDHKQNVGNGGSRLDARTMTSAGPRSASIQAFEQKKASCANSFYTGHPLFMSHPFSQLNESLKPLTLKDSP